MPSLLSLFLLTIKIHFCAAIEKVWSVAKAYFNKRMIARPLQELNKQQLDDYVEEAFRAIEPAVIARLTHANRAYI